MLKEDLERTKKTGAASHEKRMEQVAREKRLMEFVRSCSDHIALASNKQSVTKDALMHLQSKLEDTKVETYEEREKAGDERSGVMDMVEEAIASAERQAAIAAEAREAEAKAMLQRDEAVAGLERTQQEFLEHKKSAGVRRATAEVRKNVSCQTPSNSSEQSFHYFGGGVAGAVAVGGGVMGVMGGMVGTHQQQAQQEAEAEDYQEVIDLRKAVAALRLSEAEHMETIDRAQHDLLKARKQASTAQNKVDTMDVQHHEAKQRLMEAAQVNEDRAAALEAATSKLSDLEVSMGRLAEERDTLSSRGAQSEVR
jgi:hypothetical protein